MKSQVNMSGRAYGGYDQQEYVVRVGGPIAINVDVTFDYLGDRTMQESVTFSVPAPVARRLGHALLLASSGPLTEAVVFQVNEKLKQP